MNPKKIRQPQEPPQPHFLTAEDRRLKPMGFRLVENFYVLQGDKRIKLRKTEYQILQFLLQNRGKILSKENILKNVWGGRCVGIRTIDVHLTNIRKKLGRECIETVPQGGIKINPQGAIPRI